MKLFLDTASIEEIRTVAAWGVLGGITTNPSLVAKEGDDPDAVWKTILTEVDGDVSLEVTASGPEAMEAQGRALAEMGPYAVVKLPMTPDGLAAATRLGADGIRVNITLVFSAAQAILAAEAGAYCVSPFLGRLDDAGSDGMGVLRTICDLYAVQGYQSKVLAASLRHPMHVVEAALAGADIATMPFEVFTKLVHHPLTDIGLQRFQQDWDRLQGELGRRDTEEEG
jgi:transaldolase